MKFELLKFVISNDLYVSLDYLFMELKIKIFLSLMLLRKKYIFK